MAEKDPSIIPLQPEIPPSAMADGHRAAVAGAQKEIGGRKGPDPVRYGDWEKNGRCVDF